MYRLPDAAEQRKSVNFKHAGRRFPARPRRAGARDVHLCAGHATPLGRDDGPSCLREAQEGHLGLERIDGRAGKTRWKVVRRVAHLSPDVGAVVRRIFGPEREKLGECNRPPA